MMIQKKIFGIIAKNLQIEHHTKKLSLVLWWRVDRLNNKTKKSIWYHGEDLMNQISYGKDLRYHGKSPQAGHMKKCFWYHGKSPQVEWRYEKRYLVSRSGAHKLNTIWKRSSVSRWEPTGWIIIWKKCLWYHSESPQAKWRYGKRYSVPQWRTHRLNTIQKRSSVPWREPTGRMIIQKKRLRYHGEEPAGRMTIQKKVFSTTVKSPQVENVFSTTTNSPQAEWRYGKKYLVPRWRAHKPNTLWKRSSVPRWKAHRPNDHTQKCHRFCGQKTLQPMMIRKHAIGSVAERLKSRITKRKKCHRFHNQKAKEPNDDTKTHHRFHDRKTWEPNDGIKTRCRLHGQKARGPTEDTETRQRIKG